MEIDSVMATANPAVSSTALEPPPAMTPRMIPRMLTRPSWPPKITSRSQLACRCSPRCCGSAGRAGPPAVRTARPSRVSVAPPPSLWFIGHLASRTCSSLFPVLRRPAGSTKPHAWPGEPASPVREFWIGLCLVVEAADVEQFEAERFDLGQHAVQRGLVGDGTAQERVAALCLGAQIGERAQHRRAQVAAEPDLVARRWLPAGLLAGHWLITARPGVKALAMLARAKVHRAASRIESASTAGTSPMNPAATPTPTTGMVRPQ